MRRVLLVFLAACASAPAPAQPPAPAPAPPPLDPLSEASLVADLTWLTAPARAGRGSTTPEARATARWLAGELRAAGYAPIEQPIPNLPDQVNVIAVHGTAGPVVIVSAHYDHLGVVRGAVHPGADDNASGVAIVLALARDLQRRPAAGRIVLLFTGAEEIRLLGAKAYVAAPLLPLAETRAVFNLDMVGRDFGADGPALAAVGLTGDPDLGDAARAAAAEAGLTLHVAGTFLVEVAKQQDRSDDWVFRNAGIYAVDFSTGLSDDYHSPRDTLDKLSRPQLVRVARFLRGLVDRANQAR